MGAAKQGKTAIQITQIAQIKSQITPIRIVWRFAQERHFDVLQSAFKFFPCNLWLNLCNLC